MNDIGTVSISHGINNGESVVTVLGDNIVLLPPLQNHTVISVTTIDSIVTPRHGDNIVSAATIYNVITQVTVYVQVDGMVTAIDHIVCIGTGKYLNTCSSEININCG